MQKGPILSSPRLLQFYRAYSNWEVWYRHQWMDNLRAPPYQFRINVGLCCNLWDYTMNNGGAEEDCQELSVEMHDQFVKAGLDAALPFNESSGTYEQEQEEGACVSNPARIRFVVDRLIDQAFHDSDPLEKAYEIYKGKLRD